MKKTFKKPLNQQTEDFFLKKIFKFFKSKWTFVPPKKKKILIFDGTGLKIILSFFDNNKDVGIYYRRFEEINFFILFLSLFDFSSKFSLTRKYQFCYIKYVNPELMITFIDNLYNFYELKNYFKKIKFISIQNGLRNLALARNEELGDFEKLKKKSLKVDYLFTFNEGYREIYSRFIDGNIISLGSVRNNSVSIKSKIKKNKNINKKSLLYISQFNFFRFKNFEKKNYTNIGSKWFSYKDFKKAEFKLIPELVNYCKKKNIFLKILGKTTSEEEFLFYKNIINDTNFNWKYFPKKYQLFGDQNIDTYKLIDEADAVVFIDSALGYESLSRETPTAGISIRKENLGGLNYFNFGYPAKISEEGPFWTNSFNKEKINSVLDFVLNIDHKDWIYTKNKYAKNISTFNNQNQKLKNILRECLE